MTIYIFYQVYFRYIKLEKRIIKIKNKMDPSQPFKIVYISSPEKAIEIADGIDRRKSTLLGFDIESSDTKKVDLISLAENNENEVTVYLFHVALTKNIPKSLKTILEGDRILKSGNGLNCDITRLQNSGISFSGGIELSHLSRIKGLPPGLKELWNTLFPDGYRMKDLSSNTHGQWDKPLNSALMDYAAYDAYASLVCCYKLMGIEYEPSDITTSDANCPHYREWISNWINQGNRRTAESLLNQTIASYGPWAKRYKQEVKISLAKHNLKIGVEEGRFGYEDKADTYFPIIKDIKEKEKIEPKELTAEDYKLINTLKYDSACNFLFTSSKNFNKVSSEIKREVIRTSLDKAIKDGKLKSEGGKLYVV